MYWQSKKQRQSAKMQFMGFMFLGVVRWAGKL